MPLTDPPLPARRTYRPRLLTRHGERRRAGLTGTVLAALRPYGGPVDVEVDPVTGHAGGRGHHQPPRLALIARTPA